MKLYAGLEAGGTKFICVVAESPTAAPVSTLRVDVTTPDETLAKSIAFLERFDLKAIGIASFGPVDLRRDSQTYGYITTTPKAGWKDTDLAQLFTRKFPGVPVGFDTDVDAAAIAEFCYGAAQGLSPEIYITVGTGIGGGLVVDGEAVHGLMHPEMGHMPVPRHPRDDYVGHCIFHGDCLEGMASGPAIEDRWGRPAKDLPRSHEAWTLEAYYLARAACTMVYTVSPRRIAFGGGVIEHQPQMFPIVRRNVTDMLNGYIRGDEILVGGDALIGPPGLGDRVGMIGALELARRAIVG